SRRCWLIVMLGRVKAKDILSLPRSRIDRANVLATLHLPDRGHYSVLLHSMIGDILHCRFGHRTIACCISRAFNRCGLILRHFCGITPLRTSWLVLLVDELLHMPRASVYQTAKPVNDVA